jgi:uncharacterized protein YutE (UPF0331/DUF86 family)
MVLRTEAVRQRLLRLEEVLSRLEELKHLDVEALGRSFRDAWAAERGLQLAAEIVFDAGNHILSGHFGVSAKDYDDILDLLAAQGVIEPAVRERLKGLGGFRNLLVHDYLRLDPARIAEALAQRPGDFSAFVTAVRRWLASL